MALRCLNLVFFVSYSWCYIWLVPLMTTCSSAFTLYPSHNSLKILFLSHHHNIKNNELKKLPYLSFSSVSLLLYQSDDSNDIGDNDDIVSNGRGIDNDYDDGANNNNPMSSTSRLSHAMLKVPSVDESVKYWTSEKGGVVLTSTSKKKDDSEDSKQSPALKSAFVALGNGKTTKNSFALELVETSTNNFQLGNAIQYVGISMLRQYQNNPIDIMTLMNTSSSTCKDSNNKESEPNGIPVQYCASAPGDHFARLCLKAKDLQETESFYGQLLGMDIKAADDNMLCLRYDTPTNNEDDTYTGVQTTLVFEKADNSKKKDKNDPIIMGNCLDHLAVSTSVNIEHQFHRIQEVLKKSEEKDDGESSETAVKGNIFMKPTKMFGKTLMGIVDPNGYKVILFS